MSEQRKAISRQEFYEKVWTTPIVRLAQELGYSYPELIAIITAQDIPRPSGGYWYRLSHGGTSEQVPLPPISEGAEQEIPFGPRLKSQPILQAPTEFDALPAGDTESTPATDSARANAEQEQEATPTETKPVIADDSAGTEAAKPMKSTPPVRVAPEFPNSVELTRKELYQHVWSTPIHLLSTALGLSDVGLAKTCKQMEIPRPGRGYWARLDAGEPVEQIPLPSASPEAVTIWTFNVAANRQRRADWGSSNLSAPNKSKTLPAIALPGEQEALHEIAERHRAGLEKAKPDGEGLMHLAVQTLFRCDVTAGTTSKLIRAIHSLVVELEKHKFRFVRGDKEFTHLSIAQGNDRLTVHWREVIEEFEREPTLDDKRKPSWMWQLKQKRATGQLAVEVSASGLRGQRGWTESESKPLEEVLARVVEKIAATFEGFEALRQREAERNRQRIEHEKQRAELEAKRQQEWKEKERLSQHENRLQEMSRTRRSNLFIAAQRWEDSERALAYLNALEKSWRDSAAGELSPAQSQWLAWARGEAQKVAPSAENYPDPESVQRCDPAVVPIGGPYPTMTKLKRSELSREEPKPESSPYSSYPGYSR
jgi:hypothetical protein